MTMTAVRGEQFVRQYIIRTRNSNRFLQGLSRWPRLTENQMRVALEIIDEQEAQAAEAYATSVKPIVHGHISVAPRADALDLREVRNGHYRVEHGDGSSLSVRIAAWQGKRYVNIGAANNEWARVGRLRDDGELQTWREVSAYDARRTRAALAVVQAAQSTGEAYLLELNYVFTVGEDRPGNCVFCGLPIRTDQSTTASYGPDCAKQRGLPWGQNSIEVQELRRRVAEVRERLKVAA